MDHNGESIVSREALALMGAPETRQRIAPNVNRTHKTCISLILVITFLAAAGLLFRASEGAVAGHAREAAQTESEAEPQPEQVEQVQVEPGEERLDQMPESIYKVAPLLFGADIIPDYFNEPKVTHTASSHGLVSSPKVSARAAGASAGSIRGASSAFTANLQTQTQTQSQLQPQPQPAQQSRPRNNVGVSASTSTTAKPKAKQLEMSQPRRGANGKSGESIDQVINSLGMVVEAMKQQTMVMQLLSGQMAAKEPASQTETRALLESFGEIFRGARSTQGSAPEASLSSSRAEEEPVVVIQPASSTQASTSTTTTTTTTTPSTTTSMSTPSSTTLTSTTTTVAPKPTTSTSPTIEAISTAEVPRFASSDSWNKVVSPFDFYPVLGNTDSKNPALTVLGQADDTFDQSGPMLGYPAFAGYTAMDSKQATTQSSMSEQQMKMMVQSMATMHPLSPMQYLQQYKSMAGYQPPANEDLQLQLQQMMQAEKGTGDSVLAQSTPAPYRTPSKQVGYMKAQASKQQGDEQLSAEHDKVRSWIPVKQQQQHEETSDQLMAVSEEVPKSPASFGRTATTLEAKKKSKAGLKIGERPVFDLSNYHVLSSSESHGQQQQQQQKKQKKKEPSPKPAKSKLKDHTATESSQQDLNDNASTHSADWASSDDASSGYGSGSGAASYGAGSNSVSNSNYNEPELAAPKPEEHAHYSSAAAAASMKPSYLSMLSRFKLYPHSPMLHYLLEPSKFLLTTYQQYLDHYITYGGSLLGPVQGKRAPHHRTNSRRATVKVRPTRSPSKKGKQPEAGSFP